MATRAAAMSPNEIADLLATVIAGAAGGTKARWRKAIGPLEKLPTWRYVRFNWRVTPRVKSEERKIIDQAVEIVRAEHPYIAG